MLARIRLLLISILTLTILACVAGYYGIFSPLQKHVTPIQIDGFVLPTPQAIEAFTLTDNNGNPFTEQNLQKHWTMMFFGFTNCGMVCPTTMAALNDMYKTLEKKLPIKDMPLVVMVSVDPDRDSVARMNAYVKTFNLNFIGARADKPQIDTLKKELHLVSVKLQADGGNNQQYTINHSAEVILFNPQGQVEAFFAYPHKASQMVQDYQAILKARG